MPGGFEPWVVMLLPPGGFFMIGVLLLVANWHDLRTMARDRAAREQAETAAAASRRAAPSVPEPEGALV
jgi:electron transport complex protein RnfE